MTGHAFALAMASLDEVNGPEDRPRKQDAPAEWDRIDWRAQEGQVQRLRQRIFTAAQEQDWPRVRNLQKLMLRSRLLHLELHLPRHLAIAEVTFHAAAH